MELNIIGSIVGIGAVALVAFVVGGSFTYLFLRANPKKKAFLDEEVAKLRDEVNKLKEKL